jgi:hypothetical protein
MKESSARKFLAQHSRAFIIGEGRTPAVTTESPDPDVPNLQTMTRAEIDAYGAERGIDTTSAHTKAEAIEMIGAGG